MVKWNNSYLIDNKMLIVYVNFRYGNLINFFCKFNMFVYRNKWFVIFRINSVLRLFNDVEVSYVKCYDINYNNKCKYYFVFYFLSIDV